MQEEREIESKILEIDCPWVEEKLISIGARVSFDGELYAVYFDHDNYLARQNKAVRLRKAEQKNKQEVILTYKEIIVKRGIKSAREPEVVVTDFETMETILNGIGLQREHESRKKRKQYTVNGVNFAIDTYLDEHAFIPTFLEIEANDEETVYRNAELLGFSREDCLSWSLADLIRYYRNK